MDKSYKTILILVILIIVFTIISYLKNTNTTEQNIELNEEQILKPACEESCRTDDCIYGCYTTEINVAVAEGNINSCNKINVNKVKQECVDKVNLALGNCDKISDGGLKSICKT